MKLDCFGNVVWFLVEGAEAACALFMDEQCGREGRVAVICI